MFAENGRGKTTLCAVLRSLSRNAPGIIIGRATLGSAGAPEVQLLFESGNVAFRDGAWNAQATIAVFDGTFVSENVFAGDVVDTEQRRNLYQVIIGSQGVALARELTRLDSSVRAKNSEIRENRATLQPYMAPGMSIADYIALPEDPAVDSKIESKEQDLAAARHATAVEQRPGFAPVTVPTFPASFAEILGRTLVDVSADVERRLSEHVARHQMTERGEAWLSQGLHYIVEDECPFCAQQLGASDLIKAYRNLFSAEYYALRDEVKGLNALVERALSDGVASEIEQVIVRNAAAAEFWQQVCSVQEPLVAEAGQIREPLVVLRQSAKALLQKKSAAPLDTVAPDEDFTHALQGFEALRASLADYNAKVAASNAVVDATKQDARLANVRDVEAELAKLKAHKVRHSADVRVLCEADALLQGERTVLDSAKTGARDQLDAHTQEVITRYGQSINLHLERINAGFRITTPTHNYRGGPPSTSYQIVINQTAVNLGDVDTPLDQPSFGNTLSTSDKGTLALAFFLAQLEQDSERADKIVVFDDPFSSLDSFRRNQTVNQIYRCGDYCAQVVLLSHEPTFLKLLWDRVVPADRKGLQLARIGEGNTTIVEWNIERALLARYRADIDALQRFFSQGDGDARETVQKLRPVLEGYCKALYPTQFTDQDTLGVIVGKIRTVGVEHPLNVIADDLEEINIYCRRYHHGENPGAATEPLDDAELQGYVRKTLTLVGCSL